MPGSRYSEKANKIRGFRDEALFFCLHFQRKMATFEG